MSEFKKSGIIQTETLHEKLTPSEYIDLEYIESTGTQWINLNKSLDVSQNKFYFKISPSYLASGSTSGYSGIIGENSSPQMGFYSNGWTVGNSAGSLPFIPKIGEIYELEYSRNFIGDYYINGLSTGLSRTGTMTCKIFYVESKPDNCKVKLFYSNSINKDGTYNWNIVPVKRISDSVLGMYDLVSKTFYTNSGSGTFIAGPVLSINAVTVKQTSVGENYFIEY